MVRRSSAAPVALAARVHLAVWWTATALLALGVSGSPVSAQDWGPVSVLDEVNAPIDDPNNPTEDVNGPDHWPVVVYEGMDNTWVAVWESGEQLCEPPGCFPPGFARLICVPFQPAESGLLFLAGFCDIHPDHDILLARSDDGGQTWMKAE